PLPRDQVIEGTITPGLADIGGELATRANSVLASLDAMLDTALVSDLRGTLQSSERLMRYLSDSRQGPTAEVNATMRQLQVVSARFDSTLAGIDAAALTARLDTTLRAAGDMSAKLGSMTSRIDSLLARINSGQGTLGRMVSDTGLYAELQKTLTATRALVDSLANHPEKMGITVRIF
ncbi:MAG TPA: hypothetical protein PLL69_09545, partial [Gemmatimonadales bacterium]|nr:hypothetical protein [Gemmatimonadales bacterium]